MEALGAHIEMQHGYVEATIPKKLVGAEIVTDMVTVTGTENIIMAAVLANGRTIIKNAAKEPEVCDLTNFLNAMGAQISGIGTNTIIVDGVNRLHGGTYRVMPDRIEAGTYLAAAALTRGTSRLQAVVPNTMTTILEKLSAAGAKLTMGADWI
jgi:UDP-N-acetylglucosamine 1-carboxyvinyltransferase